MDKWMARPKLVANHNDEYEFIEMEIAKVRKYVANEITLYNLSVQDDESYIAKGFVVHNCLCTMIAEYLTPENTEQEWNRPSPYESPYSPREMEIFANG